MREFCRATAVLALAGATLVPAGAQSLQRVTVRAFTLSADTLRPRAGASFHLVVSLRLRERAADVRNLQLPFLGSLQVLGDTRTINASTLGTLYREVVTVSGPSGAITIPPATFDAVDARDGKAKEYATNALGLRIQATTSPRSLMLLARVLVVGGVATAFLGLFLIWRASRPRSAQEPESTPEPQPTPSTEELLREARETLATDPTRLGALRARNAVRRMVGARDGETLADVIDRAAQLDRRLLTVLPALERAAFTDEADLSAAISDARESLNEAVA